MVNQRRYVDGAELPYRVTYYLRGKGTNEVRFSENHLAHSEVVTLVRRGYAVNLDVWNSDLKKYVTQNSYN